MTIESHKPSEVPARMGGAAFGLLLGFMLGGPIGATIGGWGGAAISGAVGPVLTPVMEAWVAKAVQEFQRSGGELAGGAADASDLDEEEVVQRILTSDSLQLLVMRVLDVAARTNSTFKLRALGAILGEAVCDRPRQIDEDIMIVAALNDLDAPHLRVLEALDAAETSTDPNAGTSAGLAAVLHDLSAAGFHAALGGLVRHGLVEPLTGYGAAGYGLTDFGRVMLTLLRRLA